MKDIFFIFICKRKTLFPKSYCINNFYTLVTNNFSKVLVKCVFCRLFAIRF